MEVITVSKNNKSYRSNSEVSKRRRSMQNPKVIPSYSDFILYTTGALGTCIILWSGVLLYHHQPGAAMIGFLSATMFAVTGIHWYHRYFVKKLHAAPLVTVVLGFSGMLAFMAAAILSAPHLHLR